MEQMINNYNNEFEQGGGGGGGDMSIESILIQLREKDAIIEELKKENESLKNKMQELNKTNTTKKAPQSRYWSKEEHQRFLEALEKFGKKDVKSISAYVGTRSPTQVRTHAQKYFLKLKREAERKKKGIKKGRKSANESEESEEGDSSYDASNKMSQKPLMPGMMNNILPIHPNGNQNNTDAQLLLDGIRKYDHENDMKKKVELIQKEFLPHKTIDEVAQMISTYPIFFNPESTDPLTRYYYLPQQYVFPTYPNAFTYHHQQQQQQQQILNNGSSPSSSTQSTTSAMTQTASKQPMTSSTQPSQQDVTTTSLNQQEKDDEEELENELQNLQNNSNKKSLSGGLGGFIGHTVVLSPTVFHGTPLVLGSPLMSHTPILSESLTPQPGFMMGKMSTSPLYFVGADHRK